MEVRIPSSMFEGLYLRGLRTRPEVVAAVRPVGLDLHRLEPSYPVETWLAALLAAARCAHPEKTEEQAIWQLGRCFTDGFLETLLGEVVGVTLPMLGPARLVERIPRYVGMGRPDVKIEVAPEGARRWRATFQDSRPCPAFMAGCIERGLERTGCRPTVEIAGATHTGFLLNISW